MREPNDQRIVNSGASEEDIARLLNHARHYCAAAPLGFPRGFDPAKHVLPNGQPNIQAPSSCW